MNRVSYTIAAVCFLGAAQAQAQVTLATAQDLKIGSDLCESNNNIRLDSWGGPTNPLFMVHQNGQLLFTTSVFGSGPDTLTVTFNGSNGLLLPGAAGVTPNETRLTYLFGSGNNFNQFLTFIQTGNFNGSVALYFLASSPDYQSSSGSTRNAVGGADALCAPS